MNDENLTELQNGLRWRKMKDKDIHDVEYLLRDMENSCVTACGRFLSSRSSDTHVWRLCSGKGELLALLINSRSTLIPVLCGMKKIPPPDFLKGFLRLKKIHSVQGLTEEVRLFENALEKMGKNTADIFDYDLMDLDNLPSLNALSSGPKNLVLRVPRLTDLDAIAPLQAAYEQEEVLPKGSVFSYAASRVNIANIVSGGRILAAEIDGRPVGKINVSAVSFTRYQVGGVYVRPEFRGMGIARRMAAEFITSLISEGRGVTLFVKKHNVPARRLYSGLGFGIRGDYRITYY